MPKDTFLSIIERNCLQKLKFVEQRIFTIVKSIDQVAKWDGELHEKFLEKMDKVSAIF